MNTALPARQPPAWITLSAVFLLACDGGPQTTPDRYDPDGEIENASEMLPETDGTPTAATPDGEACSGDGDCSSGLCLGETDGFVGGLCTTVDCEQDVDCHGDGAVCVRGEINGDLCLSRCRTGEDCREGYRCILEADEPYCYPRSVADILAPSCETELVASQVSIHPSFPLMDRRRWTFDILSDTRSLAAVIYSDSGQILPEMLSAPSGGSLDLLDEYLYFMTTGWKLEHLSVMMLPAGPQWVDWVQPGTYTLDLGAQADEVCAVLLQSRCAGARLDIHLFFTGTPGLNTTNAATQIHLQAALSGLDGILAQGGIHLGTVHLSDITGEVVEAYQVIRSDQEALALMRLGHSPGTSREALLSLDVFLIRGFAGELSSALGLSAGIPGVMGIHGEVGTGIILSTANLGREDGDRLVGQVLAHEVGHFLGLEHTTELDRPDTFDHLADTPQCPDIRLETLQACPDFDNLMFPIATYRDRVVLTDEQTLVMRYNPLVQCE